MSDRPLVSTIIPTYQRPELVARAVRSALEQTLHNIEVIVVIDGLDEATASVLATIHDPRLRVLALTASSGVSAARNRGVQEARAEWVAWLDDQDEWMPQKLEAQYWTASRSVQRFPIVSCRFLARSRNSELLWPCRLPAVRERLDEYLFCRNSLFGGEGMVLITTALTRTELARQVPFAANQGRHQDIQWLIEAAQFEGCRVEFVPVMQPLAVWNPDDSAARMNTTADWHESLEWVRINQKRLSRRAMAGFLLNWASIAAARQRSWAAFFRLPVEALRLGRPRAVDLAAHFFIWLAPASWRNRFSLLLRAK